ncbi:hypothetical protein GIB67_026762 [Kingdonia uniflora]|uniref:S-acyltransferase n=1 Tax=Kingdonia uniflora TaxID=39325 RepID=A0A7J7MHD8_9MAGN|nr:hypothetical protein GIB67_026762 [Kingdonia uniflora]
MVRRHGWHLPFHTFQVIAISVFLLLAVAFYILFAPFLGKVIYEYVALGVYSFSALSVLIFYARCTAIDPADPGILIGGDNISSYKLQTTTSLPDISNGEPTKIGSINEETPILHNSSFCSKIRWLFCGFLVKEDCRRDENSIQQPADEEDALFCTLCNAEWLNNCVGRKNYVTFVSLMALSLLWLTLECGIGITVLVRCFTDRKATESQIIERLGVGFSRPAFATVVALCTALSFLAMFPLGELFFFHLILIRKGITTYEYVVAMRAQSEPPLSVDEGGDQSLRSSPTSSIMTAISGRSSLSLGLQYKGAWCTPPRIFVDHQDEIIPHLGAGRVPSTVDPDAVGTSDKMKSLPQRPVRISAWKLSKLDSTDAIKAGAKARASSSVLRPVNSRPHPYHPDHLSSGNISVRSSPKSSYPPSRASRENFSNLTSPHYTTNHTPSPLAFHHFPLDQHQVSNTKHFNPVYQASANQSPWSIKASDGAEIFTHGDLERSPVKKINGGAAESSSSSVFWDQEAGRFVSATWTNGSSSSQVAGRELLYTGQSIFFGGPLTSEGSDRGSSASTILGRGSTSSQYQQGRSGRRGNLPVFVPSDSHTNNVSSRLI